MNVTTLLRQTAWIIGSSRRIRFLRSDWTLPRFHPRFEKAHPFLEEQFDMVKLWRIRREMYDATSARLPSMSHLYRMMKTYIYNHKLLCMNCNFRIPRILQLDMGALNLNYSKINNKSTCYSDVRK
ncbi:hypothetical protein RF11_08191 [Thelohanellus kitauei]|uniref:Uncharacterized protein n=1 Tax=Thelohanellus kitauei TaxID=669202 RepID=A0A0C2NBT5_THEKT|nr:hypothetical protein RF11_08191 [Thelohanellus kitauei]